MSSLLYLLGGWAARHRGWVVLGWLVLLIGLLTAAGTLGARFDSSFSIPGTPAQVALDTMEQRFGSTSNNATLKVIFTSPSGDISADEPAVDAVVSALGHAPGVSAVQSPFESSVDARGEAISNDGSMAYATATLNSPASAVSDGDWEAIRSSVDAALGSSGLQVAYSGMPDPQSAGDQTEAIGLLLSLVVLTITFGSLLAAGMPLVTAGIGVALTSALITVASNLATLSATTPVLAEMLGLAVGIDYALFIISRHRSQLAAGMEPRESVAVAVATAGSAVLFAGTTVVIALLGLLIVGIPFLSYMGIGAAVAVIVAMIVAVTLVPAVLALLGHRLTPKPGSRTAKRESSGDAHTLGRRWVGLVTAKPLVTLLIAIPALLVLALPAAGMRLALPDAGADPAGSITRTGYDALATGWGPGTNGPLIAIADLSHTNVADIATNLTALHDAFASMDGVASVSQAVPNEALDTALVSIIPTTAPDSVATEQLVHRLRAAAAAFDSAHGFSYEITGQTALGIDISTVLSAAIVPFAVVVVGLSLVLLLLVFRSIAVPLSATGGFLLSVGAAFGVTTAIFQEGFLSNVFGLAKPGPIISFMPIMVMAVLFGLAMDYQVFLVSRMRERFVASGDAQLAVRDGFAAAARVVTAASLIMMSVFFSFVPGGGATIQPLALALALGVGFDALVVRMTIIPAFMFVLGKRAWALPRSWQRLPDVDIEGVQVEGRRAAWSWQATLPASAITAESLHIGDIRLEDFRVGAGETLVLGPVADPTAVLAALAGRASGPMNGFLSVLGVPLPYENGVVRRKSALVVRGGPALGGTLQQAIRELARLERLGQGGAERLQQRFAELSALAGLGAPAALAGALDDDGRWLLDLAVALESSAQLLLVDFTRAPAAQQLFELTRATGRTLVAAGELHWDGPTVALMQPEEVSV